MKFVKIITSVRGTEFSVPEGEAKRILESDQQLIPILRDGKWAGETINKAHIVATTPDPEATREHRIHNTTQLADPDEKKPPLKDISKFKPTFIKKHQT